MTTKMKKLIIVLLCVFVHFADAQKENGTPLPKKFEPKKLPPPTKTKPKTKTKISIPTTHNDTTINGTPFVWYKRGYVARNQKIVLLNSQSSLFINFGRDSLLNSIKKKFATALGIGNYFSILTKKTCACSNNLVLLEYPGLESVEISPDPDGSSSGGNDDNGGDGFSPSQIENTDDKTLTGRNDIFSKGKKVTKKTLKIAYIDTGITLDDPVITGARRKIFYTGQDFGDSSNPNRLYGKNFTDDTLNENIEDDSPNKHGTNISHILVSALADYNVKIMPLKVFKNGGGVLFDALCALMYAKNEKFNIVNCSWGHGGARNAVFNDVMKILQKDKIIVVCSAGNKCQELGTKNYTHYPAMFSKDYKNVVTVSIIKNPGFSENLCCNYSSMYVNLNCRGTRDSEVMIPYTYTGSIPSLLDSGIDYEYGSSYATAWATGIFAKKYFEYGTTEVGMLRSRFLGDNNIIRIYNGKRVLR